MRSYLMITGILGSSLTLLPGGCPATQTPEQITVADDQGEPADNSGSAADQAGDVEEAPVPAPSIKADAGQNQHGVAGELVVLDGSASAPGQGARLVYIWQQVGGPTTVSLIDGFSSKPRFFAPSNLSAPTTLEFRLTVSDGFQTASSEVQVLLQPA